MSLGSAAFKLAFQLSPIILTNGIASQIPGGMLPIIAITEAANFINGLLTPSSAADTENLDNFFAHFQPIPGTELIDQEIAHYPFANQAVAANATIRNPLTISMLMICPVREEFGYASKLITMMALQKALLDHNASGGTYTVVTPSTFYTDCLLTAMRDVTPGESKQVQTHWQWDFEQPLLTEEQAQQAYNNLMNQIAGQNQIQGDPAWSGPQNTVGIPPSLASPLLLPVASGLSGAGVASALAPPTT